MNTKKYSMIVIGDRQLEVQVRQILRTVAEEIRWPRHAAAAGKLTPPADRPDVIIMNSVAISRYKARSSGKLRLLSSTCRLLVVTDWSPARIIEASQIAEGLVFRHLNLQHLPAIMRLMEENHLVIPAPVFPEMMERNFRRRIFASLTPVEQRILRLLAHGCTNQTIAGWLRTDEGRTKYLVRSLLKKLALQNRTQAAVFAAHELGLLSDPAPISGRVNGRAN